MNRKLPGNRKGLKRVKKELKKINEHEIEVYTSIKISKNKKSVPKKALLKKPVTRNIPQQPKRIERKRPAKTSKAKKMKSQKVKENQILIKTKIRIEETKKTSKKAQPSRRGKQEEKKHLSVKSKPVSIQNNTLK